MANTITVAAYHKSLQAKEKMSGTERVIVNDNGDDKTVTAEVFKAYIGDVPSGGNAEDLAVFESLPATDSVTISTRRETDEGGTARRAVKIPAATEMHAGVMTAEQVKALANATGGDSEALEKETVARKEADEALAADIAAASTKADNAQSTADAASTAASAASTKAESANTAASAASEKAESASTAASAAKTAASAASTKAESASEKAESASTKAESASTAASEAQITASAASTKAESASTAASEAKTAASAASTKAESASEKAESASEKAESASTAASAAQSTADAASTAASTAQSTADAAKTAAESASTKAEAAQATADAHAEELAAHADTLKSHGTRITALEESGGGTAAVTHFMALAGEDCTITINGTAHALTAHKPYETDLALADDTLTSLVFDEAATRSLRTVRFTGKKVKWRAGDRMFCSLPLLTSADITAIDTGGAAIMSFFVACPRVTRIDGLESLDTSSFTQIRGFLECCCLENVDPSLWDTSSVTVINTFIYNCGKLRQPQLDLSQWDTSKVKRISSCLKNSQDISSVDMSGWDFSSLESTPNFGSGWPTLYDVHAGEGWGKMPGDSPVLDLSGFSKWQQNPNTGQNTVKTLLNLYDRAANGMGTMTLKLASTAYAALTSAEIATLTAKGYTVTK